MNIQILLHSSKTMRIPTERHGPLGSPALLSQAKELIALWRTASLFDIRSVMKLSDKKAQDVQALLEQWSAQSDSQIPALDAFVGDIYSGLQVQAWTEEDRAYAHEHLLVLSGLYGGLRACDGVLPYRLEMGYKLPDGRSMYQFWGDAIAMLLPPDVDVILNLSAVEYTKALLPYIDAPVITPKFLTVSPKTGRPTFVTVHTKIARGAFARWMITNRVETVDQLWLFTELGYAYDAATSTPEAPVFICQQFEGLGLSVRLSGKA